MVKTLTASVFLGTLALSLHGSEAAVQVDLKDVQTQLEKLVSNNANKQQAAVAKGRFQMGAFATAGFVYSSYCSLVSFKSFVKLAAPEATKDTGSSASPKSNLKPSSSVPQYNTLVGKAFWAQAGLGTISALVTVHQWWKSRQSQDADESVDAITKRLRSPKKAVSIPVKKS